MMKLQRFFLCVCVLMMVRDPVVGVRGSSAPLVLIQPGVDTLAQQVLSLEARLLT